MSKFLRILIATFACVGFVATLTWQPSIVNSQSDEEPVHTFSGKAWFPEGRRAEWNMLVTAWDGDRILGATHVSFGGE